MASLSRYAPLGDPARKVRLVDHARSGKWDIQVWKRLVLWIGMIREHTGVLESVTAGFSVVDEQAWRAWTFEVVVGKVWPVKFTKLVQRLLGGVQARADKDTPISI
jgi:hypothetical protein